VSCYYPTNCICFVPFVISIGAKRNREIYGLSRSNYYVVRPIRLLRQLADPLRVTSKCTNCDDLEGDLIELRLLDRCEYPTNCEHLQVKGTSLVVATLQIVTIYRFKDNLCRRLLFVTTLQISFTYFISSSRPCGEIY